MCRAIFFAIIKDIVIYMNFWEEKEVVSDKDTNLLVVDIVILSNGFIRGQITILV